MQRTMIWIAAAALIATPAAAQDNATDANADVATESTVTTNDAAAMNGMAADANMDMNMAPAPVETAPVAAPAPAPSQERGFPWGAIGLVGLIGLLGRKRGD